MLRRRYIPPPHTTETPQQSLVGYTSPLHGMAYTGCSHSAGQLRAQ